MENEDAQRGHGPFIDIFCVFRFYYFGKKGKKTLFGKKHLQFESFLGLHDPLEDPFSHGFTGQ